jgi:hypothetical protein
MFISSSSSDSSDSSDDDSLEESLSEEEELDELPDSESEAAAFLTGAFDFGFFTSSSEESEPESDYSEEDTSFFFLA